MADVQLRSHLTVFLISMRHLYSTDLTLLPSCLKSTHEEKEPQNPTVNLCIWQMGIVHNAPNDL